MTRRYLVICLVLTALACGPHEVDPTGTWRGDVKIKRPSTGNKALDAQFAEVDKKPVPYELVLRPDKTYTETVAIVHKIDGTWTFEGRNVVLTPLKVDGKKPDEVKESLEKLNSKLQISLPLPEGLYGPESATLSDDHTTLMLPSVGTTAELKKEPAK